jgi:hypothetical protein
VLAALHISIAAEHCPDFFLITKSNLTCQVPGRCGRGGGDGGAACDRHESSNHGHRNHGFEIPSVLPLITINGNKLPTIVPGRRSRPRPSGHRSGLTPVTVTVRSPGHEGCQAWGPRPGGPGLIRVSHRPAPEGPQGRGDTAGPGRAAAAGRRGPASVPPGPLRAAAAAPLGPAGPAVPP